VAVVSYRLQRRLLREARARCFIHRLTWVRVTDAGGYGLKWEALHIHHVKFRSCGGSDALTNLVPLCPTCHEMVHRYRADFLSDNELKKLWTLWKRIDEVVPRSLHIGDGARQASAVVTLDTYGISCTVTVDSTVMYSDVRREILARTVSALSAEDPHFPFLRRNATPPDWKLTSDDLAQAGEWNTTPAHIVFAAVSQPLRVEMPVVIAMNTRVPAVFSALAEHRMM